MSELRGRIPLAHLHPCSVACRQLQGIFVGIASLAAVSVHKAERLDFERPCIRWCSRSDKIGGGLLIVETCHQLFAAVCKHLPHSPGCMLFHLFESFESVT